jgi:hypothetical protein
MESLDPIAHDGNRAAGATLHASLRARSSSPKPARMDEALGYIRRLWDGETIKLHLSADASRRGGEVLPALRGARV